MLCMAGTRRGPGHYGCPDLGGGGLSAFSTITEAAACPLRRTVVLSLFGCDGGGGGGAGGLLCLSSC